MLSQDTGRDSPDGSALLEREEIALLTQDTSLEPSEAAELESGDCTALSLTEPHTKDPPASSARDDAPSRSYEESGDSAEPCCIDRPVASPPPAFAMMVHTRLPGVRDHSFGMDTYEEDMQTLNERK